MICFRPFKSMYVCMKGFVWRKLSWVSLVSVKKETTCFTACRVNSQPEYMTFDPILCLLKLYAGGLVFSITHFSCFHSSDSFEKPKHRQDVLRSVSQTDDVHLQRQHLRKSQIPPRKNVLAFFNRTHQRTDPKNMRSNRRTCVCSWPGRPCWAWASGWRWTAALCWAFWAAWRTLTPRSPRSPAPPTCSSAWAPCCSSSASSAAAEPSRRAGVCCWRWVWLTSDLWPGPNDR